MFGALSPTTRPRCAADARITTAGDLAVVPFEACAVPRYRVQELRPADASSPRAACAGDAAARAPGCLPRRTVTGLLLGHRHLTGKKYAMTTSN